MLKKRWKYGGIDPPCFCVSLRLQIDRVLAMKRILMICFAFSVTILNAADTYIFQDKDGHQVFTNKVGPDGKPEGDLAKYDILVSHKLYDAKPTTVTDEKVDSASAYPPTPEKNFDPKKPCINRAETEMLGPLGAEDAKLDYRLCLISKAHSKRGITNKKEIWDYKMMVQEVNSRY